MAGGSGSERFFASFRYKSFVAGRYLLNRDPRVSTRVRNAIVALLVLRVGLAVALLAGWAPSTAAMANISNATSAALLALVVGGVLRHSKPAMVVLVIGSIITGFGYTGMRLTALQVHWLTSHIHDGPGIPEWYPTTTLVVAIIGSSLVGLAVLFGTLRAVFTFFTTVPIGGVWLGTFALIVVLSVMSGFETDLREKILGSNAHIQVTREDGDLDHWRDVKKTIDAVPGVVASTPYAQSEVVIAANGNGQNVIIKGIDPKTVGAVTKLVTDLEDKDALGRMQPLVDDNGDLIVKPRDVGSDTLDPDAPNQPSSGDPIDYSKPAPPLPLPKLDLPPVPPENGAAEAIGSGAVAVGSGSNRVVVAPALGSGALGSGALGSGALGSGDMIPIDASFDTPAMSRRTQSLPGVLVGRELVKQTHLYQGEEVRVVSPLADPSNPDANGTPIPYNRDYRIAGVFYTGMYEYDLKYIYVTLDSFQEFLDRGDSIDGIEVRITDPDDSDALVSRIGDALGAGYRVVDWKELNRSLFSALKLEKIAMFVVLGIVILVASFSIVGNLIMVVVEKAREIALLKTLGASDAGVMQVFAIQGLIIGLVGTVIGVASGLILCYLAKNAIPLDPNVYYIDRMPIHVDVGSVVVTILVGVVISIIATFYPARLAARIRPADGLRH